MPLGKYLSGLFSPTAGPVPTTLWGGSGTLLGIGKVFERPVLHTLESCTPCLCKGIESGLVAFGEVHSEVAAEPVNCGRRFFVVFFFNADIGTVVAGLFDIVLIVIISVSVEYLDGNALH